MHVRIHTTGRHQEGLTSLTGSSLSQALRFSESSFHQASNSKTARVVRPSVSKAPTSLKFLKFPLAAKVENARTRELIREDNNTNERELILPERGLFGEMEGKRNDIKWKQSNEPSTQQNIYDTPLLYKVSYLLEEIVGNEIL